MKIEIDKIGSELSENLDKYKWPVWQIFLWLLGIIPSLIYEIWRRYKINNLKAVAIRQRSHRKRIKNKSKGDGRDKNRVKFIITSKNFSKTF